MVILGAGLDTRPYRLAGAEYQARYLKPLGQDLVISECERVAQATVIRLQRNIILLMEKQ